MFTQSRYEPHEFSGNKQYNRNHCRMPKQPGLGARSKNKDWRLSLEAMKAEDGWAMKLWQVLVCVIEEWMWLWGESLDMAHQNLLMLAGRLCPELSCIALVYIQNRRMWWVKWTPQLEFQETYIAFWPHGSALAQTQVQTTNDVK